MYDFTAVINGNEDYREIRNWLHDYLKKVMPSDHFLFEVAINEAICNSIANRQPDQQLHLELKIRMSNQKKLIIRMKDNGPGFPGNLSLHQHRHHPERLWTQERLLAESGRGLWIMDASADYLTYNEKGNELLLVKNLNDHESAAALP